MCPSHADLAAFNDGSLPPASWQAVADHLQVCVNCEHALVGIAAEQDPALRGLREQPNDPVLEESALQRLVGSVRGIALNGSTIAEPTTTIAAPPSIPGFEIEERIGHGGMGIVYRARQLRLNRTVALKVLPPLLAHDPDRLRRFRNEAAVAASFTDSRVLQVFDVLEVEGVPVLVLPYIEGRDLSQAIKDRRALRAGEPLADPHPLATLPDSEYVAAMLGLLDQIVDAVAAVHEARVLHRDVKPSNCLVDRRGSVWLSDFGLARLESSGNVTIPGQGVGTPGFMSPEQWEGRDDLDARVDVFSVGATIYQALTLELPYGTVRLTTESELPRPPSQLQALLPRGLDAVALKALEPDRSNRYPSAEQLRADWRRVRAGLRPTASQPGPLRRINRFVRRRPAMMVGLLVAFLVGAFLTMRGPPDGDLRTVVLTTQPPGAKVAVAPLGPDGLPLADEVIRPATGKVTPLRLRLAPGDYFVEVEVPGYGFHQVYRHVPDRSERLGHDGKHRNWATLADGAVEWPDVVIPGGDVTHGMARFAGSAEFLVGSTAFPDYLTPHRRKVGAFFLACFEVTVGEYRQVRHRFNVGFPPGTPANFPITYVSFDDAVAYAEHVGKRLPTEFEYEFAATQGGTRKYPWGDSPGLIAAWPFGPVGLPAFDRTATDPPVTGLYSNVAEWTSSVPEPYPGSQMQQYLAPDYRETRVVRGGTPSIIEGKPSAKEWAWGPRWRQSFSRERKYPGLGFRCARSVSPLFIR